LSLLSQGLVKAGSGHRVEQPHLTTIGTRSRSSESFQPCPSRPQSTKQILTLPWACSHWMLGLPRQHVLRQVNQHLQSMSMKARTRLGGVQG